MGMDEQLASEFSGAMRMLAGKASGARRDDEAAERKRIAEQQALLDEQAAKHRASDALKEGKRHAADVREQGQRSVGTHRATAARSGIAMSGSRALVDAARAAKVADDEQEIRDEATEEAERILTQGRRSGDMRRISAGISPRLTALSLGAKLYGNRR